MEKDSRFYKRVEDLMDFDKETLATMLAEAEEKLIRKSRRNQEKEGVFCENLAGTCRRIDCKNCLFNDGADKGKMSVAGNPSPDFVTTSTM